MFDEFVCANIFRNIYFVKENEVLLFKIQSKKAMSLFIFSKLPRKV